LDKTRKIVVGVIVATIVAAILAVGGVAAYARWGSFVLGGKEAFRLNVLEMHDATGTVVRVSGLCGPALVVKKITTKRDNTSIVVLVHVMLARPGATGEFEYDVAVPDSVNEIRFGRNEALIWTRR
jgi:hypothetical protein